MAVKTIEPADSSGRKTGLFRALLHPREASEFRKMRKFMADGSYHSAFYHIEDSNNPEVFKEFIRLAEKDAQLGLLLGIATEQNSHYWFSRIVPRKREPIRQAADDAVDRVLTAKGLDFFCRYLADPENLRTEGDHAASKLNAYLASKFLLFKESHIDAAVAEAVRVGTPHEYILNGVALHAPKRMADYAIDFAAKEGRLDLVERYADESLNGGPHAREVLKAAREKE